MVHYSVLIPVRRESRAVGCLLAQLDELFARLVLPYEIICIDDATAVPSTRNLGAEFENIRVLRFDSPRGTSALVSAGIAASCGEIVVGVSPGSQVAVSGIPDLISRLSRFDLAFAVPRRTLAEHVHATLTSAARWLTAKARRAIGDDLMFAARREALGGLALPPGALGVLPELVARHGFRVCRVTMSDSLPPRAARLRPGMITRLAAAWFDRRFEPHLARELARDDQPARQPAMVRTGFSTRSLTPPPVVARGDHSHGESA